MADDTQTEQTNLDSSDSQETAQNPADEVDSGSPPAQQEDPTSKLREYEDKLARSEERARLLEQTNQLLERYSQQQRVQSSPTAPQEPSLSPELAELDRTLSPLRDKWFKSQIDPLHQMVAAQADANDALRFETYLSRKNPEVLESEDSFNKVMQQVEHVRQQAYQVYGKSLSRIDAYAYLVGVEGLHEKSKSRQSKKTTQVKEEAKRQLEIQATRSGAGQPETKRVAGDQIESLRRRMLAGEKLTPDEKAKFRNYLAPHKF